MIFLPHLTDLKKLSALLWDCLIICRSEEHGASDQLTTFGKCLSEECSHVEKDNQA